MSDSGLHWIVIPLAIALTALLRAWGNRVIDRRRRRHQVEGERPRGGTALRNPER